MCSSWISNEGVCIHFINSYISSFEEDTFFSSKCVEEQAHFFLAITLTFCLYLHARFSGGKNKLLIKSLLIRETWRGNQVVRENCKRERGRGKKVCNNRNSVYTVVEGLICVTVMRMFSAQCVLTNAGAPIELVGSIVMETTSAFTVVPARQVDTAGVVVALNQTLCTLINIWRHKTHTVTSERLQKCFFWKRNKKPKPSFCALCHFVSSLMCTNRYCRSRTYSKSQKILQFGSRVVASVHSSTFFLHFLFSSLCVRPTACSHAHVQPRGVRSVLFQESKSLSSIMYAVSSTSHLEPSRLWL